MTFSRKQFFILLVSTSCLFADTWLDPSWEEMLKDSDLIALVEFKEGGEFKARARIHEVYKGDSSSDEIWITGFSSSNGPIDPVSAKDQYLVFLKRKKMNKNNVQYWEEQAAKNPEKLRFKLALEDGRVYRVWSPTSGDLKVDRKTVQYDLTQTSYYSEQNYFPLLEFEAFLRATQGIETAKFQSKTLNTIESNECDHETAQHTHMLRLTGFQFFSNVFRKVVQCSDPVIAFSLAKLLGNIEGPESTELLVTLLEHEHSLVQGETVRHLAKGKPDVIGPILLKNLPNSGWEGQYPENLMDPVINFLDGGKVEIIRALAQLNYQPAIPYLLPYLESKNDRVFCLVVECLDQMGSKEYIPYIIRHLEMGTEPLRDVLCRIVVEKKLWECIPAVKGFIQNRRMNNDFSCDGCINSFSGLATLGTPDVKKFLLDEFQLFLGGLIPPLTHDHMEWISTNIYNFERLGMAYAKPSVYNAIFKWHGISIDFVKNPELYKLKVDLEKKMSQMAKQNLIEFEPEKVETLVFINNSVEYSSNFKPDFEVLYLIKLKNDHKEALLDLSIDSPIWDELERARKQLSKALDIPIEYIGARAEPCEANVDDRFDYRIAYSPLRKFYGFLKKYPEEKDRLFLKSLYEKQKDLFNKSETRAINETIKHISSQGGN